MVLVTDQRVGDRFGWLGVRTYDSGWDDESYWTNIGYAGGYRACNNADLSATQEHGRG